MGWRRDSGPPLLMIRSPPSKRMSVGFRGFTGTEQRWSSGAAGSPAWQDPPGLGLGVTPGRPWSELKLTKEPWKRTSSVAPPQGRIRRSVVKSQARPLAGFPSPITIVVGWTGFSRSASSRPPSGRSR